MAGFYHSGMSQNDWIMSGTPTVIDYNHHSQAMQPSTMTQPPAPVQPPDLSNIFNDLVQLQLQMINNKQPLPPTNIFEGSKQQQLTSFGPSESISDKYNPFVEDIIELDMDISDEEKESQNVGAGSKATKGSEKLFKETSVSNTEKLFKETSVSSTEKLFKETSVSSRNSLEVKSGAAFYQGLILYIPPFEQLVHSYRGSPALKMLYASFEFSFKLPVKIETKPRENELYMSDATVYFRDHIISTCSGFAPHVEASVMALELLSETCYTIQAKEDYFIKCTLVDAENMKTLNLKKWEAVIQKYPKIVEVTKDSHIQKTIAVFLNTHTSTGIYEDIVCCNLTRQDVGHIKSVVEFFHLTMLPCSISTNISKKNTPCVVSIHKYTSAKKLLDILIECGGENDKFRLHPPDTFKDFYKLHPNYWDPNLRDKPGNKILINKTTLEDPALQAVIMEPYENFVSELFEKHKTLPTVEKVSGDPVLRKAGDDFMKSTFHIDMDQSKNVAPVDRMQLLLKYMEQLQEYGSRVLTSGRADMIKIYHNAIDNVRKDLDECRKAIEKEQKDKEKALVVKTKGSSLSNTKSRSPARRKKTPPSKRSKSPVKMAQTVRTARSKSPRRHDRTRRSPSGRRPRSPLRKARSKSPRRPHRVSPPRRVRSPMRVSPPRRVRSPMRVSPPRRVRSPMRVSPPRRVRSPMRVSPPRRRSPQPSRSFSKEDDVFISIFKDQFRRYMDTLRRFRIEIEDTPIERRGALRERLFVLRDQLDRFKRELMERPAGLSEFQYEFEICMDELSEQNDFINGKPGPNDLPPKSPPMRQLMDLRPYPPVPTPHPSINVKPGPNDLPPMSMTLPRLMDLRPNLPLPTLHPFIGARILPPADLHSSSSYRYPPY